MANEPLKPRNPDTHKPSNTGHLATAPRTSLLPMQPLCPDPPHPPSGPGACSPQPGPGAARPSHRGPDSRSGSAMGAGRGPSGLSPTGLSPTALSRDGTGNRRGRDRQRTTTPSSLCGRTHSFSQSPCGPLLGKESRRGQDYESQNSQRWQPCW